MPVGITVVAMDAEIEHTIMYDLVVSDDSAFFSIDRTSGVVSLAHAVDYDPPANDRSFTFNVSIVIIVIIVSHNSSCDHHVTQVLAIDDATPPLTGTATIIVTIDPENDNAPIITNPPGEFDSWRPLWLALASIRKSLLQSLQLRKPSIVVLVLALSPSFSSNSFI